MVLLAHIALLKWHTLPVMSRVDKTGTTAGLGTKSLEVVSVATAKQIQYATNLLARLGYDLNNYDLENMDNMKCNQLILDLIEELEG